MVAIARPIDEEAVGDIPAKFRLEAGGDDVAGLGEAAAANGDLAAVAAAETVGDGTFGEGQGVDDAVVAGEGGVRDGGAGEEGDLLGKAGVGDAGGVGERAEEPGADEGRVGFGDVGAGRLDGEVGAGFAGELGEGSGGRIGRKDGCSKSEGAGLASPDDGFAEFAGDGDEFDLGIGGEEPPMIRGMRNMPENLRAPEEMWV